MWCEPTCYKVLGRYYSWNRCDSHDASFGELRRFHMRDEITVIGSIAHPSLALFLVATSRQKETSAHKSIQCTEVSFMRLVSGSYCSTYIPWFAYFSA